MKRNNALLLVRTSHALFPLSISRNGSDGGRLLIPWTVGWVDHLAPAISSSLPLARHQRCRANTGRAHRHAGSFFAAHGTRGGRAPPDVDRGGGDRRPGNRQPVGVRATALHPPPSRSFLSFSFTHRSFVDFFLERNLRV